MTTKKVTTKTDPTGPVYPQDAQTKVDAVAQALAKQLGDIPQELSFPAQVWNTLSRVDVADYIETAQIGDSYSYQYLSWSYCWSVLMRHYPESEFEVLPEQHYKYVISESGRVTEVCSTMVSVKLTIRDGLNELSRSMFMPVMDKKFNALVNPTSRHCSDAILRCLVKCIAVATGLGLDLWTGSDLPVGQLEDPITPEQAELLNGLLAKLDDHETESLYAWLGIHDVAELPAKKYQQARKQLERKIKSKSK